MVRGSVGRVGSWSVGCWSGSVLSNHLKEGKSLEVLRDTEAVGGEVGGRWLVGGAWWHLLGVLKEGNDAGDVVDREGLGRDALLGGLGLHTLPLLPRAQHDIRRRQNRVLPAPSASVFALLYQ